MASQASHGLAIQMMTYHAGKKHYQLWHFDSDGNGGEAAGQWDDDAKTLTWRGS